MKSLGEKFYITTAIDYVNSVPHIGTAYEKICADALARFMRLAGRDVFFLMGNDEHSTNVEKRAIALGLEPLKYCDDMEQRFVAVWKKLHISYDKFIRTTCPEHRAAVTELFTRIHNNGDLSMGKYSGWYCVSCEAYKKESDLQEGKCPVHHLEAKWIEEENIFFALSKYRDRLLAHIEAHPEFIQPKIRRNEILGILNEKVEDVSISRSSTTWGVPVPSDPRQVIWVWFDALINYISGIGFPGNPETFNRYWPADMHMIGKDITRLHCIMWPAMLMSAGIPLPRSVFAHGFIYVKGQKMSKTLGTVIDPGEVADSFGTDALRYFLLRETAFDKDGDFSWEKFFDRYNSDLANDLGNLLHRTLNMVNRYQGGVISSRGEPQPVDAALKETILAIPDKIVPLMTACEFHDALAAIWVGVKRLNTYIEETAPWTLNKRNETARLAAVLANAVEGLRIFAILLKPFIPASAEGIWEQIGLSQKSNFHDVRLDTAKTWEYVPLGSKVNVGTPLFPRKEVPE